MSWGINVGGTGVDAGAAAAEAFTQSKQYSGSEPHHAVVDALSQATQAFAAAFPDKVVTVESNGHIDSWSGYATLTLKVYQPATVAAEP